LAGRLEARSWLLIIRLSEPTGSKHEAGSAKAEVKRPNSEEVLAFTA